ncbi:MAG: hypothetical protein MJ237_00715 [bacterium]|nr:hypothetical protein [bacterium]
MVNRIPNTNISQNVKSAKQPDEIVTLNKLIKESFQKLSERAEREVPEYGDFSPVFETFKNPDNTLCATDFLIQISKPPKTVENHQTIRNFELVAYNFPSPYKISTILKTGTKEELMQKLQNENIYEEIESRLKSIAKDLKDV